MSKEIDELHSYFKAIDDMDEGELFNRFNEMYKSDSTTSLKEKIDDAKLQINNSRLSISSMSADVMETGNVRLNKALQELRDALGIKKAIKLSKLIIKVNIKLAQVIATIITTRELMNNVTDEGEDGGPEDNTTD